MKKRKLFALLLCAAFLVGCGDGNTMDLSILIPPEEEDPFPLFTRVGFIYDTSVQTGTLTAVFENARFELERTLGVETRYIENVLLQQFDEAVDKLIAGGCTIIVAASNRYNSAVVTAARKNLGTVFLSYGGSDMAFNLSSIQPLLFQAANVNGFLAAFNTATNKVGMVVDPNMYHSHGIAASFALGVSELQHAQVEVSLNWALSTRISDTRRAIDDIKAQGGDIVFIYQAEDYGIRYAEELGMKVMGFAYDVPELAPENYLTGILLNLNSFFIDTVRTVMYGNFSRTLARGGFNEGTVNIIRLNDELLIEGSRRLADTLIGYIADGSSPVFSGEVIDRDNIVRIRKGESFMINQVFSVNWLPENITVLDNMSVPLVQSELIFSTLEVKQ
jgi:simple sugar transport system substrate-binding protein